MRTYLKQTEDEFIVIAELPGFSKDDVSVKITETSIDISAQKKSVSVEKGKGFLKREMSSGSEHQMFTLPLKVDANKSKIDFHEGTLVAVMPKAKKRIKIKQALPNK